MAFTRGTTQGSISQYHLQTAQSADSQVVDSFSKIANAAASQLNKAIATAKGAFAKVSKERFAYATPAKWALGITLAATACFFLYRWYNERSRHNHGGDGAYPQQQPLPQPSQPLHPFGSSSSSASSSSSSSRSAAAPAPSSSSPVDLTVATSVDPIHRNTYHLKFSINPTTLGSVVTRTVTAARFIFVIDTSGSMQGNRIESVKQGIKSFLVYANVKASCDFKANLITFDVDAQTDSSKDMQPEELNRKVQSLHATGCDTKIIHAVQAVTRIVETIQDAITTTVVFLTDGENSSFTQDISSDQTIWKQKKVKFISVGVEGHDVNILRKIVTAVDGKLLPGSVYHKMSRVDVGAASSQYAEGHRSFSQIVKAACEVATAATYLTNMSIALGNHSSLPTGEGQVSVGQPRGLGSLKGPKTQVLTVPQADGFSVNYTFTAMTIDRKQVRLTGTANLSLAQNADVLWDVVDQEMSSRILEVLKSYQQNNPTTHPKCFAIISIVLARVNAVQGQMPTHIKTRKENLEAIQRCISSKQALPKEFAELALTLQTMAVASTDADDDGVGSTGASSAPGAIATTGDDDESPVQLGVIQAHARQLVKDYRSSQIAAIQNDQLIMKVANFGFTKLSNIVGYFKVKLGKQVNLKLNPKQPNADGSFFGEFAKNSPIALFGQKHGLTFQVLFSPESEITIDAETQKAAGVKASQHKTYFQWAYPATIYRNGQKLDGNELQNVHDLMTGKVEGEEGLSQRNISALLYGFYIYYSGKYFRSEDPTDRSFSFSKGEWKNEEDDETYSAETKFDREIQGISVLDPNQILPGQFLPFGEMVELPARRAAAGQDQSEFQTTLQQWVRDPSQAFQMRPVTFGGLYDSGIRYFKWLPPKDPMIVHAKKWLREDTSDVRKGQNYGVNGSFAANGAFAYLDKDGKAFIMPVVDVSEAVEKLQNRYFIDELDPTIKTAHQDMQAAACSICFGEANMTLPCGHTVFCHTCVTNPQLQKICETCKTIFEFPPQRIGFDEAHLYSIVSAGTTTKYVSTTKTVKDVNGSKNCATQGCTHKAEIVLPCGDSVYCGPCISSPTVAKVCTSCKKAFVVPSSGAPKKWDNHNVYQIAPEKVTWGAVTPKNEVTVLTRLAQVLPILPFHFGRLDLNFKEQDWLTNDLLGSKSPILSPKFAIGDRIRQAFNLPGTCTKMAFAYPVYAKDYPISFQFVHLAEKLVGILTQAGKTKEAAIAEGLFGIGGFVFFDGNDEPQTAVAFLKDETHNDFILISQFEDHGAGRQAIDGALKALETRQNEKRLVKQAENVGRISLQAFLAFAEHFQFEIEQINGEPTIVFHYLSHEATGKKFFRYVMKL